MKAFTSRLVGLLGIFLLVTSPSHGQGDYSWWVFGDNALRFAPTGATTQTGLGFPGGGFNLVSLTDGNGRVAIAGTGYKLYGTDRRELAGVDSARYFATLWGSAVLLRRPGSSTRGYIVTANSWDPEGVQLRYGVWELNECAGSGTLVSDDSVLRVPPSGVPQAQPEQIITRCVAVRHADGRAVWLVAGKEDGGYCAFLLDSAGIHPRPVVSVTPYPTTLPPNARYLTFMSALRASRDGRRLAASCLFSDSLYTTNNTSGRVQLLRFNAATGSVTPDALIEDSIRVIPIVGGFSWYNNDLEFSPDGSKLYWTSSRGNNLRQYNLTAGTGAAIGASQQIILSFSPDCYGYAQLQLGPDGRLYVGGERTQSLLCYINPNVAAASGQLQVARLPVPGTAFSLGCVQLPRLPNDLGVAPLTITSAGTTRAFSTCGNQLIRLTAQLSGLDSSLARGFRWRFGDPVAGSADSATGAAVSHMYQALGTYRVTVEAQMADGQWRRAEQELTVWPQPMIGADFGADSTLCTDEATVLTVGPQPPGSLVQWSDNSTGATLPVGAPGLYSVEVSNEGCCTARASVLIRQADCPIPLPNIITPANLDGLNDALTLLGRRAADWRAQIFNRWGRCVYETAAYANDWAGAGLAAGTYYYNFTHARTGERLKGWVEVVK